MSYRPVIFGIRGTQLSADEGQFFHQLRPWGVILVARNIESRSQLCALTDDLREQSGNPHLPVLIDQEGGRVARLRPPLAEARPSADLYRQIFDKTFCTVPEKTYDYKAREKACEAARLGGFLLAADLHDMGININCAPCLDLGLADMSDVIGDRSFGSEAKTVALLGRAMLDGLHAGGVLGVIKHLPGHGRARVDSHAALPLVDNELEELAKTDFAAFQPFNNALMGMTGHLLFRKIDATTVSTFSPRIINDIIRETIGFDGLLMSDDLSMKALQGDYGTRVRHALSAGCDMVLHCNGDALEMRAIAAALPAERSAACAARAARVEAALRAIPRRLDDDLRSHNRQVWGELVGDVFPAARNAV